MGNHGEGDRDDWGNVWPQSSLVYVVYILYLILLFSQDNHT